MVSSGLPCTIKSVLLIVFGGALLTNGALAAADPSPVSLSGDVIGVVGSGEKLSLRIMSGEAPRTLDIGEVYRDGWTLSALTATAATLTKDGQSQIVGLNPTGVVERARPDAPLTTVRTVEGTSQITVEQIAARQPAFNKLLAEQLGAWDGKTPRMGLTLAETRRYVDYQTRGALYPDRFSQAQGPGPKGANGFLSEAQVIEGLGIGADDYLALNQKLLDSLNAVRGYTPYLGEPRVLNPRPAGAVPIPETQLLAGRQSAIEALLTTVPGRSITPPAGP